MAMDRYTMAALVTAPVVFCLFTAAMALALGLLLLPSRKHRSLEANEETAPGLWSLWQELDRAFVRLSRSLLIDTNFNASISEQRRYAGLFKQHVTMRNAKPMLPPVTAA
jgi:hypothetical protein